MEIWKPVEGLEFAYEVSSHGRVRSVDRACNGKGLSVVFRKGLIRKPRLNKDGYLYLMLYMDGTAVTRKVHRLVASAFCEKPDGCDLVNHKDGNKVNNSAENLEWVTSSQNARHAISLGLYVPRIGEDSAMSTMQNDDIDKIREMIISGSPIKAVAEAFNTTVSVVMSIRTGRRWSGVGDPGLAKQCAESRLRGKNHPKRKLSDTDVLNIIEMLRERMTTREIAKIYGVGHMAISNINTGTTWSNITPPDGGLPPYNKRYKNRRL